MTGVNCFSNVFSNVSEVRWRLVSGAEEAGGISMEVVQEVGEGRDPQLVLGGVLQLDPSVRASIGQPKCDLLVWDSHRVIQTTLTSLSLVHYHRFCC